MATWALAVIVNIVLNYINKRKKEHVIGSYMQIRNRVIYKWE